MARPFLCRETAPNLQFHIFKFANSDWADPQQQPNSCCRMRLSDSLGIEAAALIDRGPILRFTTRERNREVCCVRQVSGLRRTAAVCDVLQHRYREFRGSPNRHGVCLPCLLDSDQHLLRGAADCRRNYSRDRGGRGPRYRRQPTLALNRPSHSASPLKLLLRTCRC
jgi:hypothetical protein